MPESPSTELAESRVPAVTPRPSASRALWDRAAGNAYLLLVPTMMMWGANAVAGRLAVGRVSPMALVTLRWVIAAIILLTLAWRQIAAEWPALRSRWRSILLMGSVGFTGVNAMYFLSAHYTTAVNIAILQGSMPVFVLLGALLFHRTRIRAVQAAGVAVTMVGIAVIASKGHLDTLRTLSFNPGDLLVLGMAVLYSGYTVGLRDRPKVSGIVFFSAMAFVALVTSLPLLAFEAATGNLLWPTPGGWLVVLFVALFPSLISQLMFMRAVDLIGPGRAGLFVNLVPIFGAIAAVVILHEPFGVYHAIALTMVLGGIFLAEKPAWRAAR
jgi:drug/metabolite transporter (DMT)-like permease